MISLPVPETAVFVLSVLVKGALVLGLTAGLSWLLRRWAAAYRHAAWALGLGVALLLPIAEATLPHWSPSWPAHVVSSSSNALPAHAVQDPSAPEASPLGGSPGNQSTMQSQPGRSSSGPVLPRSGTDGNSASSSAGEGATAGTPPTPAAAEASRSGGDGSREHAVQSAYARIEAFWSGERGRAVLRALPWVWGLGVLLVLGWIVGGLLQVRRWIRRGECLTGTDWTNALQWARDQIGVSRSVVLYRSPDVSVPMTAGVFRPVILLPSAAQEWSTQRRRTVLLHEMAHAKRLDYATNLIGQLACALHWANPLVWGVARRLRTERERACDDRVLAAGVSAPDYADHLVAVAREIVGRRRLTGALTMTRPSELKSRVQSILSSSPSRQRMSRGHAAVLATVLLAAVLPLAALRPAPTDLSSSPSAQPEQTVQANPLQAQPAQEAPPLSPRSTLLGDLLDAPLETGSSRMPFAPPANEKAGSPADDRTDAGVAPDSKTNASDEEAPSASAPAASIPPSTAGAVTRAPRESAAPEPPSVAVPDTTDEDEERQELQEQAVYAIGQLPSEQAVPRLLKIARTHSNTEVREMALRMLGRHENAAAIDALGEIARTDTSQDVRQAAVYALGQIYAGGEDVTDADLQALKRLATNIEDPEVGIMAVRALREVKAEAVVPILVDIATSDAPLDVREAAVQSLGELGDPRAAEALMQIANEN